MNKCINCGKEATQLHHVVPRELGGNDTTNCVWLCDKCHALIHGIELKNHQLNHTELTKLGIARAKERGVAIGRPRIFNDNKLQQLKEMKNNGISNSEAARRFNCGIATISRALQIIDNP